MHQALRERRREIENYHMWRAMVPEGERGSYSSSQSAGTRTGGRRSSNGQQSVKVSGKDGVGNEGREVNGTEYPNHNSGTGSGAGRGMKDKHASFTLVDEVENISLI